MPTEELQYFAGLVGNAGTQSLVVVDPGGARVVEFEFGRFGWREFHEKVSAFGGLGVAVEVLDWRLLNQLVMRGFVAFPVPSEKVEEHATALGVAPGESAKEDAWTLAEALRLSGGKWKTLGPEDEFLPKFRQVWDRESVVEDIWAETAARLRRALGQIFPEACALFDWMDRPGWAFAAEFPSTSAFRRAKPNRVEKFLRTAQLLETESGRKCLDLFAHLQTLRVAEADPEFELTVRALAENSLKAWTELASAQYVGAAILRVHPDYKFFGGTPPSPPDPGSGVGAGAAAARGG
jgi:hypothetical protein